jgi:DNA-binding Xre family transcriptional regulator
VVRWRVRELLAAKSMTLYRFGKLLGYKHPHSVTTAFPRDGHFKRISSDLLNRVCEILEAGPGDVIEYVPDDRATPKAVQRRQRR